FGATFNPFQFGRTPLYGFIEFDVDRDADTGGELTSAATQRYLANAGRFGGRPQGPVGPRAAVWGRDVYLNHGFGDNPQFERSGEDFALALCGCYNVSIVAQDGNYDGIFDPGETWIVQGRFFQRAGGYAEADAVVGGAYSPVVKLRFHADTQVPPTTTITLVFPLTMHGAALLATNSEGIPGDEPMDADPANQASVVEALNNLIDNQARPPENSPAWVLAHRWWDTGRSPTDYLNPPMWNVTALVGTSYEDQQPSGAYYVWTDVGFDFVAGDFNGDRRPISVDQAAVQATITALDGGPEDCDGTVNGAVHICEFAQNFCMY